MDEFDQTGSEVRGDTDSQSVSFTEPSFLRLVNSLVKRLDADPGPFQERPTELRGLGAFRPAHEKPSLNTPFYQPQPLAEGRLRYTDSPRCLSEIARLMQRHY
jgi:hypothetical protein